MAATFQNNLRRIRLSETGRWTLMSAKELAKPIHLCDFCTLNRVCLSTRRLATIVEDFDVSAVITECAGYRPAVSFRDASGLDAAFNTVRIGKAWHDRVMPGSYVTLWNSTTEEEMGVARVTGRFVGRYCDVAAEHARFNHTQVGKPAEGAEARLLKVLVNSYGSTFMKPERAVSVIYLERVHEEEKVRGQDHPGQAG